MADLNFVTFYTEDTELVLVNPVITSLKRKADGKFTEIKFADGSIMFVHETIEECKNKIKDQYGIQTPDEKQE